LSRDRVIVVGCAFWDTIFRVERIPGRDEKVLPEVAAQTASGMATVAAVTIARLGGDVSLWTRVGVGGRAGSPRLPELLRRLGEWERSGAGNQAG
jgi:sugar/nucleoside kinase (ribokinase family)